MMGRTHAVSGTLAFGGATLAFAFSVPELIIGVILATGASMMPDLDHPNATMTKSLGPLSWIACHFVILPIFGGHRKGTHSIFFAVVIGIGAQVALMYRHEIAGGVALSILMSLAVGSLVRLFKIRGWADDISGIVVSPAVVFLTDIDLRMVPPALMLGCLAHVAGDCLTDRGCPVLWPLSSKKWTVGLFTTNKIGEKIAFFVIVAGIIAIIGFHAGTLTGVLK